MQRASGVATVMLATAIIGRLASDRRHNKRIERKLRVKEIGDSATLHIQSGPQKGLVAAKEHSRWPIAAYTVLLVAIIAFWQGWQRGAPSPFVLGLAVAALAAIPFLFASQKVSEQVEERIGAEEKAPGALAPRTCLTGTWIKDKRASQDMGAAIQLAQLNRITRTAVKLIKGMQIVDSPDAFQIGIFSVIGWFKVHETYPKSGALSKQRRRDLRGHHTGRMLVTKENVVRVELEWGEPVAGRGWDEFRLHAPDELHVHSHMEIAGKTAGYITVYRKR